MRGAQSTPVAQCVPRALPPSRGEAEWDVLPSGAVCGAPDGGAWGRKDAAEACSGGGVFARAVSAVGRLPGAPVRRAGVAVSAQQWRVGSTPYPAGRRAKQTALG